MATNASATPGAETESETNARRLDRESGLPVGIAAKPLISRLGEESQASQLPRSGFVQQKARAPC